MSSENPLAKPEGKVKWVATLKGGGVAKTDGIKNYWRVLYIADDWEVQLVLAIRNAAGCKANE